MTEFVTRTLISSPIGQLILEATEEGLVGLSFATPNSESDANSFEQGSVVSSGGLTGAREERLARRHLEDAAREVVEYFDGRRNHFDVQIDWSRSGGFRRDVLRELFDAVGFGEVVTYGELAVLAGRPRAARAVGSAMATNPLVLVVPCHRVVRAGHEVGAYGGGVEAKRWLLEHEGVLQ